jgi:hypothetical protein
MTTEATTIILDPQLGITPAQFAAAWNNHPEAAAHGSAHTEPTRSGAYDSLLGASELIVIIGTGILTNLIWDVIKSVALTQGVKPPGQPIELPQPDHTRLIVIPHDEA